MGCCGDREKGITVTESQKWDYLTLSDFKSTSCLAPLSYVWLWVLVLISGAVYAADAFTAVNLLAFNQWSGEVQPKVKFEIAKWIFGVCIIISYVFLAYRWFRAIRVIRSGSVAECYLEPLAAIWQSMRLTKTGQGWRRFLVFAELTKSKKGVDYIALFVYFQFKSALIVIFAQGPRIAINAMTLWAVMQAQLIPVGEHSSSDHPPIIQFFLNIQTMAQTGNKQETIIYFTMLFSLLIWVIGALSLLMSILFYIFYLWHHVDKSDGSLTQYCRRKIETRLERIVGKKIKKALEKQDMKRRKEEAKGTGKGDAGPRMPTLPKLDDKDDDTSSVYSMSTVTTLPPYSSNGASRTNTMGTQRSAAMKPSLPSLNERPPPARSDTQGTGYSNTSFTSNAPLLSQAGDMGMASPPPPMPALDRNVDYFNGPPARGPTPNGMGSRPYSPMAQGRASPAARGMVPPVDTQFNNGRSSPAPSQVNPPYANRRPTGASPLSNPTFSPYRGPAPGPTYEMSPIDMTPNDYLPMNGQMYASSNSPQNYRPPQLPTSLRSGSPAPAQAPQQIPRQGTAPPPRAGVPAALQAATQRREGPNPGPYRQGTPQQRSATAPLRQPGYGPGPTDRSGTAPPGQGYNDQGYNDQGYNSYNGY
ncbi:hypothetical protein P280DRAFT_76916 [Massarina eburnea CBS 473.64]|uniref:Pheromone-regulated membrane protein n=1 Tax=Massarina eburnea CBS 473.64 TaxID=1395130 RepID=A0A6A6RW90_9PLEO|nr:hypothetical protein P280DRAFT_76916 [Massarina eburnea CBS 473.64]